MAYQFTGVKARPAGEGQVPSQPVKPPTKRRGSWLKGFLTLIIVLIIIGGGVYLITGSGNFKLPGGIATFQNEWQAVFLTNGQVYFGKVSGMDSEWVMLSDIYYLQVVTQPLQTSQQGDNTQPTDQQQQQEQRLTLIKLGNEIHGPRDEMAISRRQVVIMEDLRDDGRVVQAIKEYKNQKQKEAAAPAPAPAAAQ